MRIMNQYYGQQMLKFHSNQRIITTKIKIKCIFVHKQFKSPPSSNNHQQLTKYKSSFPQTFFLSAFNQFPLFPFMFFRLSFDLNQSISKYIFQILSMQNKSNENKLKQIKSAANLNTLVSPKNSSRKKTLSGRDKSQNKKPRKMIPKEKKIELQEEQHEQVLLNNQQRNEYYTNQKCYDAHKSFSENISEHALNGNKRFSDDSCYRSIQDKQACDQYGTSPKIKLDSIKGVIAFNGKLVKNQVKAENFQKKKNYTRWDISSRDFTTEIYNDKPSRTSKSQKKVGKSKSKGKNMKRTQNKSKSRAINNVPEFLSEKEAEELKTLNSKNSKHQTSQYTRNKTSRDQESDQTLCTPNLNQYERNQQIDFHPLKQQITFEEKWSTEHKSSFLSMKKILYEQRCICIKMLSKLCGQLHFKKQTFGLSIHVFDMYLSDQVLFRKMKVLALTCLEIALKLEEAENAHNFILQINAICSKSKNIHTQRSNSQVKREKQNRKVNTTRQKSKKKGFKKKTAEDLKAEEYFKKQKLMSEIIRQEIPEEELNRLQMIEFETLIALKFQFKLWKKTFAYWIDILTLIWDQFLLNENQFYHNVDAIIFRCSANPKNISFLTQILEACLYSPQIYEYSKTILVLSVMYMLVRINMEGGNQEAYDIYQKALSKSSNVLFIDRVGCNVLFGTFLLKLQIEMGAILSCCQFISNYLDIKPLNIFEYLNQSVTGRNYDQNLSYHFYNPRIYLYYGK